MAKKKERDNILVSSYTDFLKHAKQGSLFVAAKYLAFITFSIVSTLLSLNMFYQLVSDPNERAILIITAGAIEIFKVYKLIQANTLYFMNKTKAAIRAYLLYALIASASILASYGFTLTAVSREVQKVEVTTNNTTLVSKQGEMDRVKAEIARIDGELLTAKNKLAVYDTDVAVWTKKLQGIADVESNPYKLTSAQLDKAKSAQRTAQIAYDKAVAPLNASRTLYIDSQKTASAEILELQNTGITQTQSNKSTATMFALMASGLHPLIPAITEESIRFFLFLLISFLIELGIISTSPHAIIGEKYLHHFVKMTNNKPNLWSLLRDKLAAKVATPSAPPIFVEVAPPLPPPPEYKREVAPPPMIKKPIRTMAPKPVVIEKEIEAPQLAVIDEMMHDLIAPEPVAEAPIAEEKVIMTPAPATEVTSALVQTQVPLRPQPPQIVTEEVVEEPSVVPPPTYTYRLGKTTEAVKDQFILFVNALFSTSSPWPTEIAEVAGHIKKPMSTIFLDRLVAMKGSNNVSLFSQVKLDDGRLGYAPNFNKDYIISYATTRKEK